MQTVSTTVLRINNAVSNVRAEPIKGEVSDLHRKADRAFFTLSDDYASLSCYWPHPEEPVETGDTVIAEGDLGIYEKTSEYQLKVSTVTITGEGERRKRFRRIRNQLQEEETLPPTKQPAPSIPSSIAIITSKDGSAKHDVLTTIENRNPWAKTRVYHTKVQGSGANEEINDAITAADSDGHDVILLVRGGGSDTHLTTFNQAGLARRIAATEAPVITGIGHDDDTVIADLAADKPTSTPTSAALHAVRGTSSLPGTVQRLRRRSNQGLERAGRSAKSRIENLLRRSQKEIKDIIEAKNETLTVLQSRAQQHNPRSHFDAGYYHVHHEESRLDQLRRGDTVTIQGEKTKVRATIQCISANE